MDWRAKTGRIVAGVEVRVGGRGRARSCPTTASRWGSSRSGARGSPAPTTASPRPTGSTTAGCAPGTSGSLDDRGYMQISDRTKDVIKSGGEWISSVELENEVMAHPGVVEAAVIAVPDERWGERPLVAVVLEEGCGPPSRRDPGGLPRRAGVQVVAARAVGLRGRGPEDQCGQVRQEGPARPATPTAVSRSSRSSLPAARALTRWRRPRRRRRAAGSHRRGAGRPGLRPAARGADAVRAGGHARSGARRRGEAHHPGPSGGGEGGDLLLRGPGRRRRSTPRPSRRTASRPVGSVDGSLRASMSWRSRP